MPKMEKITVSLQYAVKANLGNFENADARIGREETWDVSDMSLEDANFLYESRRAAMKAELDPLIENEYKEMLGK